MFHVRRNLRAGYHFCQWKYGHIGGRSLQFFFNQSEEKFEDIKGVVLSRRTDKTTAKRKTTKQ